jgi:hypothetical protein
MFDVLTEEQRENAYICHGVPMGRGPIEGIRFDHAWVEVVEQPDSDWDDPVVTVYDFSNGSERVIPAFLYYKIGDINPKDVKRYTDKQAYEKMEEKRFYGPWD